MLCACPSVASAAVSPSGRRILRQRSSRVNSALVTINARRPSSCRIATAAAAVDLSDLSSLPGDPSLTVHTNVAMGDRKMPFMKAASKAVARCLGKPESFVVVAVMDEQALIWGGEDAPCALCTVNSLGGINKENNTALSGELTSLMGEFGVTPDRMYALEPSPQSLFRIPHSAIRTPQPSALNPRPSTLKP